jgi:hypothetical protein
MIPTFLGSLFLLYLLLGRTNTNFPVYPWGKHLSFRAGPIPKAPTPPLKKALGLWMERDQLSEGKGWGAQEGSGLLCLSNLCLNDISCACLYMQKIDAEKSKCPPARHTHLLDYTHTHTHTHISLKSDARQFPAGERTGVSCQLQPSPWRSCGWGRFWVVRR